MNTRRQILLCLLPGIWAWNFPVLAADPPVKVVRVFRSPGTVAELCLFGGKVSNLNIEIEGPQGVTAGIEGRLYQIAGGLAAPIGTGTFFGEVKFDGMPCGMGVPLALPEVKVKTEMDWQFRARIGEKMQPAGGIRLFVYPEDLAAPLRKLALHGNTPGCPLGIFGTKPDIRAFLKAHKVEFEELGERLPADPQPRMLCIGDASAKDLEDWLRRRPAQAGVRLVVFLADPWSLPGIYTTTDRSLRLSKVTAPVLENLADDPQSQDTFVNILMQPALHTTP